MDDSHIYSVEHVRLQMAEAQVDLGCYELHFYADGPRPSKVKTDRIELFYYFPSGGTIRDREMNIVFYEPKLDKYHPSNRTF